MHCCSMSACLLSDTLPALCNATGRVLPDASSTSRNVDNTPAKSARTHLYKRKTTERGVMLVVIVAAFRYPKDVGFSSAPTQKDHLLTICRVRSQTKSLQDPSITRNLRNVFVSLLQSRRRKKIRKSYITSGRLLSSEKTKTRSMKNKQ